MMLSWHSSIISLMWFYLVFVLITNFFLFLPLYNHLDIYINMTIQTVLICMYSLITFLLINLAFDREKYGQSISSVWAGEPQRLHAIWQIVSCQRRGHRKQPLGNFWKWGRPPSYTPPRIEPSSNNRLVEWPWPCWRWSTRVCSRYKSWTYQQRTISEVRPCCSIFEVWQEKLPVSEVWKKLSGCRGCLQLWQKSPGAASAGWRCGNPDRVIMLLLMCFWFNSRVV